MKRIFTILAVFFVVGVFTSKAQSPSDSSYVRDLNYTFFNMSSLPNSITDSLANGSKILKDLREGKRGKGYAITVNFNTYLDIQLVSGAGGWDSYLFLLDANFQEVAYNDDWNGGSRITHEVTAGQYYIVVSEYSKNTTNRPYTLTVDTISVTPLNQLTFTPVSLPFSIQDTFRTDDPTIVIYNTPCIAKGYSFQGTQGKFLMFDEDSTMGMDGGILLDKDYNEIMLNSVMKFSYTGTYYLVLVSTKAPQAFSIKAEQIDMPVIYVDGVNGDDSRNGLTAGTAIKTLDTAIARTKGIGKYLLTDDYTFNNQYELEVYYAEVYPYGKDINLKISANCEEDIFEIYGMMIFGENGSDYYFIIDSNSSNGFYDFLDADHYGTTLEVNNLKIRNSYIPNTIFWGDSIILRNCEFTNDTIEDYFVGIEEDQYNSLKLINCNISQNRFRSEFIYQDYDSMEVTLENTIVSGNTFSEDYPVYLYAATINLTSGNWRNNNLTANYSNNGNPNLSVQNCAGIWANNNTIINIGSGFTMDVNNYICLDTSSVININKNLSASVVAQVYPFRYDNSDYKYYGDYYEGRPMLIGSAVANNFQKFSVAQADNNSLWYLHSDGKLYTTVDPNGIAQAEVPEVRMYPNPAADRVTIDLQNTTANKIRMVDLYGRIVVEQDVDGQMEVIDLSHLANGMYFVQICNNGKVTATRKLMKN